MKSFSLKKLSFLLYSTIIFVFIFVFQSNSFAQIYEYNIAGEHFSDTLYKKHITKPLSASATSIDFLERKANFESSILDTTYVYHQVGQGENIEYILKLYQICAPCFAKWNNFLYPDFTSFHNYPLYEGEYLKIMLKKDYEKGTSANTRTRNLYQTITTSSYLYTIADNHGISIEQLRLWNNLNEEVYEIENVRLIVGQTNYNYACPCLK